MATCIYGGVCVDPELPESCEGCSVRDEALGIHPDEDDIDEYHDPWSVSMVGIDD